jgi:hypothetical protein
MAGISPSRIAARVVVTRAAKKVVCVVMVVRDLLHDFFIIKIVIIVVRKFVRFLLGWTWLLSRGRSNR